MLQLPKPYLLDLELTGKVDSANCVLPVFVKHISLLFHVDSSLNLSFLKADIRLKPSVQAFHFPMIHSMVSLSLIRG